ncbi:MAG: twin-arginine translocation signal domain-containing protein [Pseudaminobacter sp.]
MLDNPDYGPNQAEDRTPASGTSRRGFLKIAALAGAAVSFDGSVAHANGEIGFWVKDLTDQQLIDMYTTILRIRWHERSMADKMLTDPNYRGYNHFYAGQEAVATGVCAALRNAGGVMTADLIYSTHRPSDHALAKGVDLMARKSWMYSVIEAVQHEMREDPNMVWIFELTPPVASNPGKPVINLEKEFGRGRVVNTGIDENWMVSATLGAGLAGSKAATYIPYQGACMPFQVIQNHAGKLRS